MISKEMEEFARLLIQEVRDTAIRNCDGLLMPQAGSRVASRFKAVAEKGGDVRSVLPDVIDQTVFCLLHAMDQGSLQLRFVSSSGREVNLTTEGEGELSGWYAGSGGWRAKYSEERFFDDTADLAGDGATSELK